MRSTYEPTADQHERALAWYRLCPWQEVTFGRDTEDPELVRTGLARITHRLTRW